MIDYITVGNNELADKPYIKKGDMLNCNVCSSACEVQSSYNETLEKEDDSLLYIHCLNCRESFLVGVKGKNIHERFKKD